MARFIGIRHRVKETAEGKERPTMIAIREGDFLSVHELKTEQDELDFVLGRFPTAWREAEEGEDLSAVRPYHIKVQKRKEGTRTRIPTSYDGLREGDIVAAIFGGSGDRMTFSASREGEKSGFSVFRIPPAILSQQRGTATKEEDHLTLCRLIKTSPNLFYPVFLKDRDLIDMIEKYRKRRATQKDRIRCTLRLRQRYIGEIFLAPGLYPEGSIEDAYDAMLANNAALKTLVAEEKKQEQELRVAVQKLDVWHTVFAPIPGCGEVIAAGIIAAVGDIRRFQVEPDRAKIAELRAEASRLKLEANFTDDTDKVQERVTIETNHYQLVQLVRSWKRTNGKEGEAALLDQALACHDKVRDLKRKAVERGAAKLVAYCGVHVLKDGTFPRRRRGKDKENNWPQEARQALYLLGDQFVYQKDSEWGKRLRFYKERLRERHPEVVLNSAGKKAYTDAHIHKMAIWRTLTRFTEWLFREWTKLEKGPKAASPGKEEREAA